MSTKLLFTRKETAEELGLSIKSIDGLIKSGALLAVRIGNRVRVSAEALSQFAKTGHTCRIRPKQ